VASIAGMCAEVDGAPARVDMAEAGDVYTFAYGDALPALDFAKCVNAHIVAKRNNIRAQDDAMLKYPHVAAKASPLPGRGVEIHLEIPYYAFVKQLLVFPHDDRIVGVPRECFPVDGYTANANIDNPVSFP